MRNLARNLGLLYSAVISCIELNCCRDSVTRVNRMVDARPCNVIDVLRRVRNCRTIIIIIIIIIGLTARM